MTIRIAGTCRRMSLSHHPGQERPLSRITVRRRHLFLIVRRLLQSFVAIRRWRHQRPTINIKYQTCYKK